MDNSAPGLSPQPPKAAAPQPDPAPDAAASAQAALVAGQQAIVSAVGAKAAALNESALAGGPVTQVNITLDPDLSALYNADGVGEAFKANIAALQCVRFLQAINTQLAAIAAAVVPAPGPSPTPPAAQQVIKTG